MPNPTCSVEGCNSETRNPVNAYCDKHYRKFLKYGDALGGVQKRSSRPVAERWRDYYSINPDGCWVWQRSLYRNGYAATYDPQKKKNVVAHRYVYEQVKGAIPAGAELDHLCRNRACVNPGHLQPVSHAVNMERAPWTAADMRREQTHCKHGHEFTPGNTYRVRENHRSCLICRRASLRAAQRRYRAKKAGIAG